MLVSMPPVLICPGCEQRLTEASNAMRRHASQMNQAIDRVRRGLTEAQYDDFKGRLIVSFNEAQSAWNAYCRHLIEHGLLPEV